jgi:hypothetical protein
MIHIVARRYSAVMNLDTSQMGELDGYNGAGYAAHKRNS